MLSHPDHAGFDRIDVDLVERAAALRELLAANAVVCERERRVPEENLAALDEAGLFSTIVPKRCGGQGTTMATQLAVAAELGAGCASTAWVQSLINITTWGASLLAPAGQAEVFTGGRTPRVCGVLAPDAVARPVDGGFVVTGRWGFASGSLHADWACGGVQVLDESGRTIAQDVAYFPLSEVRVDDTWYVAGMKGTGSNTIVADDLFVPTRRLALQGNLEPDADARAEVAPSDRWPLGAALCLVLFGPMLGTASAALEAVRGNAPRRGVSYSSFARQIDSPILLRDLATASLDVDTAWLHTFRSAGEIDAAGDGAVELTTAELGRIRGSCGYVCDVLRRAVATLVDVGGASGFADASPVQRYWRDLNVMSRHAFIATNTSLETHGRALYDLDPIVPIL